MASKDNLGQTCDDQELRDLLDTFQRSTEQFMSRVAAIQKRININPDDSPAKAGLHTYLLYKEIIRLEDESDAARL